MLLGKTMVEIANDTIEYFAPERAKHLLRGGVGESFYDALRHGFATWKRTFPSMLVLPSNTMRAICINEISLDEACNGLSAHPRVRFMEAIPGRRRALFAVRDDHGDVGMIVQIKKLDKERRTRNIPTREARRFASQQPLKGIPIGPRITIGYRLINDGTDLVVEAVYWRSGRKSEWHFPLLGDVVVQQMPMPLFPAVAGSNAGSRVKPKPGIMPPKPPQEGTGGDDGDKDK